MEMDAIPYSATGLAIIARFIFMYLLYVKKSTNNYSLAFCILNIASNTLWFVYSVDTDNSPLLVRSGVDIVLLSTSSVYILRNKWREQMQIQILSDATEKNEDAMIIL
jgi:hypothetical protein